MGQSESLSISGGDGHRYWVSINQKSGKRGCKKTVYKGVLLGQGPRRGERLAVKSFTNIPGSKESWGHEVMKADVTKQLAAKFAECYPSSTKIRVVHPSIVEMDKVSKFDNWRECRSGHRGLGEDEWISVEEHIPGKMVRYCPWSLEPHSEDVTHSDHLQAFCHFTYHHTHGTLVACDFQGVNDISSSTSVLYIFTDSIIHSRHKLFGLFDQGDYGITEFFKLHKCTSICKDWEKPIPLTPPPPFDSACVQQLMNFATPLPDFQDIIFPSYHSSENAISENGVRGVGEIRRRRHATIHEAGRARAQQGHNSQSSGFSLGKRRSHSNAEMSTLLMPERSCQSNQRGTFQEDYSPPPAYDTVVHSDYAQQIPAMDAASVSMPVQDLDNSRDTLGAGSTSQSHPIPP